MYDEIILTNKTFIIFVTMCLHTCNLNTYFLKLYGIFYHFEQSLKRIQIDMLCKCSDMFIV